MLQAVPSASLSRRWGLDRLSDVRPKALGTEALERHGGKRALFMPMSPLVTLLSEGVQSRPFPCNPPCALCKALPCTSELSDGAWQAEGSCTSAGINNHLAKITLGTCPHISNSIPESILSWSRAVK